eukprot:CAMPEP_0204865390 /NCGR_PEP_ID=MMETSP1348-20121228/8784_1 /ASSEMBLY_ACC=CAM_ASM_000700 /TAXON_ID=215587 /ORGANISM="Aplanochytrium stocchinoi, Strain GSBS06" /LENGTH=261 /DNA_ID=CAMNT_0052016613 /DNA_START=345 /DNA_END=1127 /DNA_ORIENTATION=+
MGSAGLGAAISVLITNPLDVAKTRLQMTNELTVANKAYNSKRYRGPFDCMQKTYATEGIRGLQRGLNVAIVREFSKCCFRIGMYDPLVRAIHSEKNKPAPMYKRFIAGSICGVSSAIMFNPLDIAKTRAQASGAALSASHYNIRNNASVAQVFSGIIKDGGVKKLWYGTPVNILRGFTFTSVLLPVNSKLKEMIKSSTRIREGVVLDTFCPLIGSFVGIMVMNPVDVIRTRIYNQPKKNLYSGPIDAIYKIGTIEGITAFW